MISWSHFTHEYEKSYFKYVEPLSPDYTVWVGDEEVSVYTCRISAYPLNRAWPGFQRTSEQTTLASFVNLVSDESVTLTIEPHIEYDRVLVKPYSKGIVPVEKDGKITLTVPVDEQLVLELGNYRHCLYIFNSHPILCPDPASVTHYFGPGIHMPGRVILHSGDSVYVDKDALVFGCILAEDADDVHIFGNGLLDDTSERRFNNMCYDYYTNGNLKFYDCKRLRIEGVLCKDSAMWCLSLFNCFDTVVDGVKIFGQWRYNTDGVDIVNCQDFVLRNSFIHSFDDAVTIKGIDRYIHTNNENILVENCSLWCDWGKTCEVGIETACLEYKNITFRNCDLLRAGNTALDIMDGDFAEISHITFEDIRIEYERYYTCSQYQHTDDTVYNQQDNIELAAIVGFSNPVWRTPEMVRSWGYPTDLMLSLDLSQVRSCVIHDVVCRNLTAYFDEAIPLREDGKYPLPIRIWSERPGIRFENILVENVVVNGTRLTEDTAVLEVRDTDGFCFR